VYKIVIWDKDAPPHKFDSTTILWRSFSEESQVEVVSIPKLIEKSDQKYKERYLAWVYELGEMTIFGRSLIENLLLRNNLSYWWMTLIAEKCNFSKSPHINDAIRFIAFDDWAEHRIITDIEIVSSNRAVAECIKLWSRKRGIVFRWHHIKNSPTKVAFVRSIYECFPDLLKGVIWAIIRISECWPFRGVGLQHWTATQGRVTFFSYLFNLHFDKTKVGIFDSQYWGTLPDMLLQEGVGANWLHLYIKNKEFSSSMAADMLERLNRAGNGKQIHVALETFLSITIIFKAGLDWIRLIFLGARLGRGIEQSLSKNAGINLWPLFIKDWKKSMSGQVAIGNMLNLHLFESAIKLLPKQHVSVYLQENQSWEFGLIQIWKKNRNDPLIGCPHTTVRFWDLRYFNDSRSYVKSNHNHLPMPDRVALNGNVATRAYLDGGYPSADLVQVEALRYLHLEDAKPRVINYKDSPNKPLRLLVLGDYVSSNTLKQMDLLGSAIQGIFEELTIIVKPHPAFLINPKHYPNISMKISMEPIAELLKDCDVAYSSGVTSAAVDAYCIGTPVISVLDPNLMNLSPLRSCDGVIFISTSKELVKALYSIKCKPNIVGKTNYFIVDKDLPRWRRILLSKKEKL